MTAKNINPKPARRTNATGSKAPANDEEQRDQLAKDMLEPSARHGVLALRFTEAILNDTPDEQMPHIGNFYVELHRAAKKAEKGDMSVASRLLVAQALSATLAELAKLHQPREQTVRHVHVNEGGQAVIADHFHHHTGGKENGTSTEQHHAQGPCGPALPCPDPQGTGVPIPGDQGCEAVPNARRQRQRRTQGE